MEDVREESVGYVKFSGEAVHEGQIAADAAGNALLGLDECLRYFNRKQAPALARVPYEIPVKTTKGSWEVWLLAGIGIYSASYIKKAAEKMAENDFKDIGLKDVLTKSIGALKHLVELVKHTKGNFDWASEDLSWRIADGLVGVTNSEGEVLFLPVEYFRWYFGLPRNMLKRITSAVEVDRTLTIAVRTSDGYETTTVEALEKEYFGHDLAANEEEFLFPELHHGDYVQLEGRLTRGNENSNSVGLEYQGHILNCVPEAGNIKQYKPALFLRCIVNGTVSRLYKQHTFAERRPTIVFSSITPLESDDEQFGLFGR